MKKNLILYFSISFLIFISVSIVLFSKESKKETPDVSDYYQFWENTQPETEFVSSFAESSTAKNENSVMESTVAVSESIPAITEAETETEDRKSVV